VGDPASLPTTSATRCAVVSGAWLRARVARRRGHDFAIVADQLPDALLAFTRREQVVEINFAEQSIQTIVSFERFADGVHVSCRTALSWWTPVPATYVYPEQVIVENADRPRCIFYKRCRCVSTERGPAPRI